MIIPALPLAGAVLLAPMGASAQIIAPSGQPLTLHEIVQEDIAWSDETQLVLRLVAPMLLAQSPSDAELNVDTQWLCETLAPEKIAQTGATPDWVIVELMASPAPRGIPTPEITRVFDSYRLENDLCIWELF